MAEVKIKRSSVSGKIPATTDLQLGELAVNTHDGKLFLKRNDGIADYIVEVGGNVGFEVKNQTGSTLTKGTLVKFAGTLGSSGRLLVAPFLANGTDPSDYFIGVVLDAIPNGGDGFVVDHGKIYNLDTSAYTAGTVLYASATTAGAFTSVRPQAPNNKITVAAVVNSHASAGVLEVRVSIGSQLGNDELVELNTLTSGDTLAYNGTTARFENTPLKTVNGTSLLGSGNIELSASSELQNRYSYTAAASQTTFAAEYTAPYVDVYQNGVKLGVADYVATSGTNIVLVVAASADDLVEIVAHKTFGVADALPLAGGTLTGPVVFAGTQTFPGTQSELVSGTNIKTVGGESLLGSGNINISSATIVNYTDRANLRSIDGPASTIIIIESLGVFVWVADSTEIDDDETCFATTSGRWLLYAAAWDLVAEYVGSETDWLNVALDDVTDYLTGNLLRTSSSYAVTNIAINTGVTFDVTVAGAAVGDFVSVSPPLSVPSNLIVSATVSAANTVQVQLYSPVAASNPSGTYEILVIKGAF